MVSAGNGWFSLLGFMGMTRLLAVLFLFLVRREIQHGPDPVMSPELRKKIDEVPMTLAEVP